MVFIIALENVIQDNLTNGKIIRLDKLGSFYPSLSNGSADIKEEFDSTLIKGAGVNYRPQRCAEDGNF